MSPPFFSDQQRPWQRRRSKLGSHRGCRSSLRKTPPPERSPEGGEESSDATGNAKPSIQTREFFRFNLVHFDDGIFRV
uniref:Uncharacterized protein n=1 Tax=Oryza nivara TaxID=4536 RepID=A0A0E0G2J7_ORYNI